MLFDGAALAEGKVYTFNGEPLFRSNSYGAFVIFVPVTETEATARLKLAIADGDLVTITYSGHVRGAATIDASDATFVVAIYLGVETMLPHITNIMRFEADVNKDKTVDLLDALKVLELLNNSII